LWPQPDAAFTRADTSSREQQLILRVRQLEEHIEHLQYALEHRPTIEHAIGMIMILMPCTESVAVAALKHVSQTTNRKLRDVAALITTATGTGQPVPHDVATALNDVLPARS